MFESDELLGAVLEAAENASPLEAVEAVTESLAQTLGASAAFFLISDLAGGSLLRMSHGASGDALALQGLGGLEGPARSAEGEQTVSVPVEGLVATALRTQTPQVLPPGGGAEGRGGWVVLTPVTQRGEALGLLQLSLSRPPDPSALARIASAGHLLAYVVIANRRHTDLFDRAERGDPFTLPAEIQRRLLPAAFTCEAGAFTLAGWLEPAAAVGGDTFDYSLGRDVLHLSLTDAMGHGVAGALTATLCVGSLRNTRRLGGSLVEQAAAANRALCEHTANAGAEQFATGTLGRLDLSTGMLSIINAGHVSPYLCRDGAAAVAPLTVNLPFGLFPETTYQATQVQLRQGDRLVMVTDGMLERNAASLNLIQAVAETRTLHPREATHALTNMVLTLTGSTLADDATIMVLDWHGDHGNPRRTSAGAEQWRTSPDWPPSSAL